MISRTFFQREDPSITASMPRANQLSALLIIWCDPLRIQTIPRARDIDQPPAVLPQETEEPRKGRANAEGLCHALESGLEGHVHVPTPALDDSGANSSDSRTKLFSLMRRHYSTPGDPPSGLGLCWRGPTPRQ
ncbi:hypothetical protein AnigIFM62618_000261 [Aspergillus niger]|nr:hypothetical protein AnigIFM62618_000261 [Aspergillus niger]